MPSPHATRCTRCHVSAHAHAHIHVYVRLRAHTTSTRRALAGPPTTDGCARFTLDIGGRLRMAEGRPGAQVGEGGAVRPAPSHKDPAEATLAKQHLDNMKRGREMASRAQRY